MSITTENAALIALASQLAVIGLIDARRFIISNDCNLLLAVSGLIFQWLLGRFDPISTGASVVVFAGCFASVRAVHFHVRGRLGLGMGDVKMAAAAGCWIGIASFPLFLATSSISALAYALVRQRSFAGTAVPEGKVPFGPFVAAGLLMAWICEINSLSFMVL